MPAAHLHQLVVAAGLDARQDLAGDDLAEVGVAELVDELHSVTSATPAWTRTDHRPRRRRARARRCGGAAGVLAEREIVLDPQHPHRRAVVAAGDAVLGAAAHSITLARSSVSSCSYSAPIASSSSRVARASCLVDHGDREPDVDQDPVARTDVVEEADVDGPPDAGYVDLGELVGLVDDFQDLAGDGQAHVDTLSSRPRCWTETDLYHSGNRLACATFPGLNSPVGSNADLIARIIATAAGPCSSSRKRVLP